MGERILERYELGEMIGRGGMGAVYKGQDTRSGSTVAIKVLLPEAAANDPALIERFKREGETLRRLNHPNIVKLLAMTRSEDRHYLVMEYVSGGTLADKAAVGELISINRALEIALDLSDALARAHHLGIIHRDLKPQNVLIAADGTARLTDFGIAHLSHRTRLTMTHQVMGTLAYLSPEVLDERPVDPRADIWSFGVLLYEMLTGELPFSDPTPSATLMAIMLRPTPDLRQLRPDAPPALAELLRRMLEKDPNQRINSARLIGAELQALLEGRDSLLMPLHSPPAPATALLEQIDVLAQKWERESQEATKSARKPGTNPNQETRLRAVAHTYQLAAQELRTLTSEALKTDPSQAQAEESPYVIVPLKDLRARIEKTGMKLTNLYEDKRERVYTAIFPKTPPVAIEERVRKLLTLSPEMQILETGKLPETGEPFIDFAFNHWQ